MQRTDGQMDRQTDTCMYVRIQYIRQNLLVFLQSEVYIIEITSTVLNKITSNQPCNASLLFEELPNIVHICHKL